MCQTVSIHFYYLLSRQSYFTNPLLSPDPLLSLFMILGWNTPSSMVLAVTHFSHVMWRMDFNVTSLGFLQTEQLVYPIIICHLEHTKRKSFFNFVVVVLAHADHFILLQEIMQHIMTYIHKAAKICCCPSTLKAGAYLDHHKRQIAFSLLCS